MSKFLNFLADYYILFIILSVVLLFALIGFIMGERKKKQKGEVETASATDLPISNTDANAPVEPAPSIPVAPETPVMASEQPVVTTEVVPENMTPAEVAAAQQTLVIDDPEAPATPEVAPAVAVTPVAPVEVPVVLENATLAGPEMAPVAAVEVQPTEPTPEVTPIQEVAPVVEQPVEVVQAPVVEATVTPEVTQVVEPQAVADLPVMNATPEVQVAPVVEPQAPVQQVEEVQEIPSGTGSIFENNNM